VRVRPGLPVFPLLLWTALAPAATYTVTDDADSGAGSLRWAINRANARAGADRIEFAPAMLAKVIRPATRLPALLDDDTTLDGDIDDDGVPDAILDGDQLGNADADDGLRVLANHCTLSGLVIRAFPAAGIRVTDATHCRVTGCRLGVYRLGTQRKSNGCYDVRLVRADQCTIGGADPGEGNLIIGAAAGDVPKDAVTIEGGRQNRVSGNIIGVGANGVPPLGSEAAVAVRLTASRGVNPPRAAEGNTIGGSAPGAGNVIADVHVGVELESGPVADTVIAGNTFGLGPDGDSVVWVRQACIWMASAEVTGTRIGGTVAGARNVFAGCDQGVMIWNVGAGNRIQGNYFGTNVAGTEERDLQTAIRVDGNADGELMIGGSAKVAGNLFAPYDAAGGSAIRLGRGNGDLDATIRYNNFGRLKNGTAATAMLTGVLADGKSPTISDNLVTNALLAGIAVQSEAANPLCLRNEFRDCRYAVYIVSDARCRLGNLGNASTGDDGGNLFRTSNRWHIYNGTPNAIKAEGNDFITTSRAEIDAKIHDQLDSAGLGLVDYDPMAEGAHPTGADGAFALVGAAAVPTAAGAEVSFSLTGSALVTVEAMNVAGRPVALIARDVDLPPGLHRLAWSGRTDLGTAAPAGRYLLRVLARDAAGRQASALCTVDLR